MGTPTSTATSSEDRPSTPQPSPSSSAVLGAPLEGAPRLVIENHSTVDIRLYSASIVDEEGKLGTMALWPHPHDCPSHKPTEHLLPLKGVYELDPPTHAFDAKRCSPGKELPPGKYVVHIESGYTQELHASAEVKLPLKEPVRVEMRRHEKPPACTPIRARRAARLAIAAAQAAGAPADALRECDPTKAVCGSLPLPEEPPPAKCTLTLHETLLRIRRPPRGDPPKEITAWFDHDVVFAQRPDVSRSSSAEVVLGPAHVVLEGSTESHIHEHGGDASKIGSMTVNVFNPTKRPLKVRVASVEWLTDHSCGTPQPRKPAPAVTGFEPKELPPGKSELSIGFTPQSAYQAHCDVFASRALIEIEGRSASVTSEHNVSRIEPLER